MPTQKEINDAADRFNALPEEEQKRIKAEQHERRVNSQVMMESLQNHGYMIQALIDLDQDQAREYVSKLGLAGPGKASPELTKEIFAYIESAQLAQLNDLQSLTSVLSAQQVSDSIKHNSDLGAVLLANLMKDSNA